MSEFPRASDDEVEGVSPFDDFILIEQDDGIVLAGQAVDAYISSFDSPAGVVLSLNHPNWPFNPFIGFSREAAIDFGIRLIAAANPLDNQESVQ